MHSHERSVSPMRDEEKCLKLHHKMCHHSHDPVVGDELCSKHLPCDSNGNSNSNGSGHIHIQNIQHSVDVIHVQLNQASQQVQQLRRAFEELRRRKQEQDKLRLLQARQEFLAKQRVVQKQQQVRHMHLQQCVHAHRQRLQQHSGANPPDLEQQNRRHHRVPYQQQHQHQDPHGPHRRIIQLPSLRKQMVESSNSPSGSLEQRHRRHRLQQCLQLQHERRQQLLKAKFRDQTAIV